MSNDSQEKWLAREDVARKLQPVRELQGVLLEILKVIDGICSENGLQYYLFYGTLLGAMRHGGFIPWDDDADIVMPRSDYEKLLRIPAEKWPKGYFLQSPYTEKSCRFSFAKVRKDGTACITPEHAHIKMHQGIFVDVFPLDEVRFSGFGLWVIPRVFERMAAFSCAKLPRKMRLLSPVQKIWQMLGITPSFFSRVANLSARIMSGHGGRYIETFNTERTFACRRGFEVKLFDPLRRVDFEGVPLCVPAAAEQILKLFYGDWKAWPPEEDRLPVHSKGGVIDTRKDYSCYLKNGMLESAGSE